MISAGLVAVGAGQLLMTGIDASSEWTTLLGGFLVAGAGIGLLNPAIADVAVSVVPEEQSGMAGGINDTFRQAGVAVGTAAWGAILVDRGADKVRDLTGGTAAAHQDTPRQLVEAASTGILSQAIADTPAQTQAAIADAAGQGFLTGLNGILLLGAALSLIGAVVALWLIREHGIHPDVPERCPHHGAEAHKADPALAAYKGTAEQRSTDKRKLGALSFEPVADG